MKESKEKVRYWTMVLYPESAPENWLEYLQETGLYIAISPLHDKDLNADGECKKPHYHILLIFNGPTSFNVVNRLCEELNQPIPKRVLSVIGMYRYFTHKDNPEKYQYKEEDIKTLNGFDIKDMSALTTTQTNAIRKDLVKIINEYNFTEYSLLINYLISAELNDYFMVASTNTIFLDKYLTSKRNYQKGE